MSSRTHVFLIEDSFFSQGNEDKKNAYIACQGNICVDVLRIKIDSRSLWVNFNVTGKVIILEADPKLRHSLNGKYVCTISCLY